MVVPFAGTWIETAIQMAVSKEYLSFPSRERGLKHCNYTLLPSKRFVVPFAGTWIETVRNVHEAV